MNSAYRSSFQNIYQLISWHRYKEALKEAEQLLREEPEDPDVFALIAQIYFIMDEYGQALHWVIESMKREPDNRLAWYVRVGVYYETNNETAFYEALPEALRIDPYEEQYYFLHANMLNRKGKFNQAKEQLRHALELAPESPTFLAMMSYLEALLGDRVESNRLDRLAVRYDAEVPQALLYLAWAAGVRGDYKLKETYMRSAIRLRPDEKQYRDEYLETLQQGQLLFRIVLWPVKFLRRMKPWQIFLSWLIAWILFKPLVVLFIIVYIFTHWITKAIVHVRVFGWRRS